MKAVAQKRRKLPAGGQLKEDYVFQGANDGKVGKAVKLSELFADKNTLLLYSFMFGPGWDNPCPSCTSLVDGFDRSSYQVTRNAAFVAIATTFKRQDGRISHFWGTELPANHLDTVWPYWNLMDFTPQGRPDIPTPPQEFRSEFLEKHYP